MQNQYAISSITAEERITCFKELANRYVEIGKKVGIPIRAYTDEDLPHYHKAATEYQISSLELLEFIVKTYEETLMAGENPLYSSSLLWRAFKRLNVSPTTDAFNYIKDDDIVMIYNESFQTIFWNIQFFKVSSFTIEQLFFIPWPEITRRDPLILEQCMKVCEDVYSEKISGNIFPNIPEHTVEELNSPELIKTKMSIPFASTLKKNGKFGGLMVVQRMRVIA